MNTAALKQARMELKTTEEIKDMISQAATLLGLDSTSFVLGLAAEKAREVLSKHSVIKLSLDGQKRFAELSKNPPPPTAAMRKLKALSDFATRRS